MVTVQVGKDITIYYASGTNYHGLAAHIFGSGTRIGFVSNMSYSIEQNVEVYHAPGRRYGWGIKGGAHDVSVHLDGLWVATGALALFTTEANKTGALTAFALGASGTDQGIAFSGCRLGTYDGEFTADGWATEVVDIPALVAL